MTTIKNFETVRHLVQNGLSYEHPVVKKIMDEGCISKEQVEEFINRKEVDSI
jgi:hypothetical protein